MEGRMSEKTVSLETLGRGAAVEKFNQELARVVANILDPNTPPEKARAVTLKVTIKPDKNRLAASVKIECTSSCAPADGFATQFFMGRSKTGQIIAVEQDPRQMSLLEEAAQAPRVVEGGRA